MQNGDLAEPDQQLRMPPGAGEVELVGGAVGAFTASRRADRRDGAIAECLVYLGELVLEGAGEVPEFVECVCPDRHAQTETSRNRTVSSTESPCRGTGRRHQPYVIGWLQLGRRR